MKVVTWPDFMISNDFAVMNSSVVTNGKRWRLMSSPPIAATARSSPSGDGPKTQFELKMSADPARMFRLAMGEAPSRITWLFVTAYVNIPPGTVFDKHTHGGTAPSLICAASIVRYR